MKRIPDTSQQVFPVLRRLTGRDVYYSIEGPRRLIEWQRVGTKWMVFQLVARAFPEVQRIADMLQCDSFGAAVYEAVTCEDWPDFSAEATGAAMGGLLPGQGLVSDGGGQAQIQRDVDLAGWTTFGVAARTKRLVVARTDGAVRRALLARTPGEPLLVLGGGSNMLFHADYLGMVLKIEVDGVEFEQITPTEAVVVAGAGVVWHELVERTLEAGWAGLENLALIPGCVGASPMQNIGAYGTELKDVFEWLEAIRVEDGALRRFQEGECGFGYRESIFKQGEKDKWVITRVAFRLTNAPVLNTHYGAIESELVDIPVDKRTPKDVAEAVIRIRKLKLPDPNQLGNAGSFFKNPILSKVEFEAIHTAHPEMPNYPQADGRVKVAAGWLIDRSGWKGHDRGTHGVHDSQALVLVNKGGASGREIWQLAQDIQDGIRERFGIELEPEVNQIAMQTGVNKP
jgi:UDP-N-acetylmuramate dehydrogenase